MRIWFLWTKPTSWCGYMTRHLVIALIFPLLIIVNDAYAAEALNPRTLCPINGNKGLAILLVDTSDQLTLSTKEHLKELLRGIGESENNYYLPNGHELIIYRLSEQIVDMEKPILRVCNPGNPKDRTLVDNLISGGVNPRAMWQRFERLRKQALHNIIEQADSKRSPILESIAVLAARHIPSLSRTQRKPIRLYLFSDMLQNSKLLSHYKPLPKMEKFQSLTGYSEMESDLTNTKIWIFYIRRSGLENVQTNEHYYWWTRAIRLFDGKLMEQIPL